MSETCIFIDALVFPMFIGDEPEEKAAQQPVSIDLKAYADFSKVNRSDKLEDTVDYIAIIQTLKHVAQKKHYDMLEHFAFCAIDALFSTYPRLTKVSFLIHKPEMNTALAKKIGVSYSLDRHAWETLG